MAKYNLKDDPKLQRENDQYNSPVPSREYILHCLKEEGRPLVFKTIYKLFGLQSEQKEGLSHRLRAMCRDGQIVEDRRGNFAIVSEMDLISGRVQTNRDGSGYVLVDDEGGDVFLSEYQMRQVFADDHVLVRVTSQSDRRGKRMGVVVKVVEHNIKSVSGRITFDDDGTCYLQAHSRAISQDILVSDAQQHDISSGDYVEIELTNYPTKNRPASGKIIKILGDILTPGMETELAIRAYNLPHEWADDVIADCEQWSEDSIEAVAKQRKDLRDLDFITIDGVDARDFDDAIYCEKNSENTGWHLWVAIADVSNYVKPGTELDDCARDRGNSVYFPAKVLPMLPEVLSNGLCSLKPNVDRLVMVCEMELNAEGELQSSAFYPSVIRSKARLTYTQVSAALEEGVNSKKALKAASGKKEKISSNVFAMLKEFHSLYERLLGQRMLRGAIEFSTKEQRIVFDENGKIKDVVPVQRNVAHRMIEEAMLLANISAAEYCLKHKLPAIYRNHPSPDKEKLDNLRQFLSCFSLKLQGKDKPEGKDYASLLIESESFPEKELIQTVLLRSMQQAVYSEENFGHFGLSYPAYTHFTSPIRRYTDLHIHRLIKATHDKDKSTIKGMSKVEEAAIHCSLTERRADRATRDAKDWLKCHFMQDKVGNKYSARIVEVTSFGLFVEIERWGVQGLLHISALDSDYYLFEPQKFCLIGRSSGKVYRIGDSVEIIVARVDLNGRFIDFDSAKS